jgi:hypothetical protein
MAYRQIKPIILRRWQPGMQLLKLSLSSIPIWIKLIHLPMEYWTPVCLSHVASAIGKPIFVDSVTEDQTRLGYARVLVKINVNSELLREITLDMGGGKLVSVLVEYPWIPVKCATCKAFCHPMYTRAKEEKRVWRPKQMVMVLIRVFTWSRKMMGRE